MREKPQQGQPTFALTADVSEAHRQIPIHPSGGRFLGCQVSKGSTVYGHMDLELRQHHITGTELVRRLAESRSTW